jgi:carboxypeptidase A1
MEIMKNFEELQKIDVWSENAGISQYDVRIPANYRNEFDMHFLKKFNIKFETVIENLQDKIDVEISELASRAKYNPELKNADAQFFDSYRTLEEINTWTKHQAATNKFASLVNIGKSFEQRDILGLKIHNPATPSKGAILFHGGIHAREWISPTTVAWIAHELMTKSDTDPTIKKLVDNLEWHIFPVLNVDGYSYTHTNNRMWRKTRRPNQGTSCVGTDPNRNWAYKWNTGGSSSNPCSETFHGPKAFSEPEVVAMVEYGKKLMPKLKTYIDFHAYGQLYMRPWGWSRDAPADEAKLKKLADAAADKITRHRGKTYRSGRIAIIIYVASGSSADYFYGEHKVPSFALELGTSFTMPVSEIRPVGKENMEGVKQLGLDLLASE